VQALIAKHEIAGAARRAAVVREAVTHAEGPALSDEEAAQLANTKPAAPGECLVKSFKINVTLAPQDILHVAIQGERCPLTLRGPKTLTASIAAKSIRKAQALIRQLGADGVICHIQGKLGSNNTIDDAGLTSLPRTPKAP
jgi:hypothetical protein